MKIIISFILVFYLTGCASAWLYGKRPEINSIQYLASGDQDIIIYKDECYFYANDKSYLATGLGNYVNRCNKILIWIDYKSKFPSSYQVNMNDEFVFMGKIAQSDVVFDSSVNHISVPGIVASSHAIDNGKISLTDKIIISPFAFALDMALTGGVLIFDSDDSSGK